MMNETESRYSAEVGGRIRRLRENRGFTLNSLSLALGRAIGEGSIQMYETGSRRMTVLSARMIAEVLGVTTEKILTGRMPPVLPVSDSVVLDVDAIRSFPDRELSEELFRWVNDIRRMRRDWGLAVPVRGHDLRGLSVVLDVGPASVRTFLEEMGLSSGRD